MAAPNPNDIIRLGPQVAAIKASMPRKRWASFVRLAHTRGHTIGGELSDAPNALKERTSDSLRDEAKRTVATAYAPAQKELSTREASIGYLNEKRKADDASYRQWLSGEVEKINAQAKAADTTLATQQSTIAEETKTAIAAARADSLQRMAASPGNVSDPSTLDTSAADVASTNHIAAAREQTAALTKVGEDSRTLATASVLGQQGARESTRVADTWKALADVAAERTKLNADQAGATLDRSDALSERNVSITQTNREADLAAASLGLKEKDLAATVTEANRKYKLETKKYSLAQWKADHTDKVAQAKLKLGYDDLASKQGIAAAKRALDRELEGVRSADRQAAIDARKDKPKGVDQKERDLYRGVNTARGLFVRWDKNNAVPVAEREQHLRDMGYDDVTIAVAHDLARNRGILSDAARAQARKLGIKHSGYFWPPLSSSTPATPPGGNLGR